MTKIPKAALPVVEIIRRDVPRPRALPEALGFGDPLRWRKPITKRWAARTWGHIELRATPRRQMSCCPMGLHKLSKYPTPNKLEELPIEGITDKEIRDFYQFWDAQTDPQEAVDAVWGPE